MLEQLKKPVDHVHTDGHIVFLPCQSLQVANNFRIIICGERHLVVGKVDGVIDLTNGKRSTRVLSIQYRKQERMRAIRHTIIS